MEAMQIWQSIVLPFVAVLFGGWVTAQFALGRFRKEKVWERKTAAYTAIFEAIYDMGRWNDAHLTAQVRGGELNDETSEQLGKEYREARNRMERRIVSETWLLPENCTVRIRTLFKELDAKKDGWLDMLGEDIASLDRATNDLRVIVRVDLGLN